MRPHRGDAQSHCRAVRRQGRRLVHPTRLAVTGSNAGPSLYHLLEILGKEKVLGAPGAGCFKCLVIPSA